MTELREEPPQALDDMREILLQQLSYYRASLLAKLDGLTDDQLTTSILPSGWSPLELLKHLVFVERRWMQWGFEAEQVPDPWADHDPDSDGWLLERDETLSALTEQLRAIAARTDAIAREAELKIAPGWVVDSPAIRPRLAGSWFIYSRSMRGMSGTWTWYASWSTGRSASSPLVCPEPCSCALSLSKGTTSLSPIPGKEPAQAGAKLVPPGLP
jgi:hypothetical protein